MDANVKAFGPTTWLGSLLYNKTDGSGLLYMRNRYYDPQTGQFTQQDPIGIAGGLNLYGFAGGDPVNFSDPFGLCPEGKRLEDGTCPGGLSVAEWNAVVDAIDNNMSAEAGTAVRGKLEAGDIRGAQGGTKLDNGQVLDYDAAAVTDFNTEVIYVNRFTSSGASAFAYSTPDLAFVLAHEYGHVLQAAGATPGHRRSLIRAINNPNGYALLQAGADRYACANTTGARRRYRNSC